VLAKASGLGHKLRHCIERDVVGGPHEYSIDNALTAAKDPELPGTGMERTAVAGMQEHLPARHGDKDEASGRTFPGDSEQRTN
jgi:hypothetical protein